jgi:hypothetical protein
MEIGIVFVYHDGGMQLVAKDIKCTVESGTHQPNSCDISTKQVSSNGSPLDLYWGITSSNLAWNRGLSCFFSVLPGKCWESTSN